MIRAKVPMSPRMEEMLRSIARRGGTSSPDDYPSASAPRRTFTALEARGLLRPFGSGQWALTAAGRNHPLCASLLAPKTVSKPRKPRGQPKTAA